MVITTLAAASGVAMGGMRFSAPSGASSTRVCRQNSTSISSHRSVHSSMALESALESRRGGLKEGTRPPDRLSCFGIEDLDNLFGLLSADGSSSASAQNDGLPEELYLLLDPSQPVQLPVLRCSGPLDNWKLDKLVSSLGRNRATWRRALLLYEWLKDSGHELDDRLCTTLIRMCADHGDAVSALGVYEWMRSPKRSGGGELSPTNYTYTAAMRAAMAANLLPRALQIWEDSVSAGASPDCRLCLTYIEVCTRLGHTERAMAMYSKMRDTPPGSPMAPTVHVYTSAMRAASDGGRWLKSLDVWNDMQRAGCEPTGHAYAAVISACASGSDWVRALSLFGEMTARGIRPDVVSCTALITALASAGEAGKARNVVEWMLGNKLKPNVRTFTALIRAMGNAKQWAQAVGMLFLMQQPEWGSVAPNAYTYSALLKSLGEQGQWQLAEAVFGHLEQQLLGGSSSQLPPPPPPPPPPSLSGMRSSSLGLLSSSSQLPLSFLPASFQLPLCLTSVGATTYSLPPPGLLVPSPPASHNLSSGGSDVLGGNRISSAPTPTSAIASATNGTTSGEGFWGTISSGPCVPSTATTSPTTSSRSSSGSLLRASSSGSGGSSSCIVPNIATNPASSNVATSASMAPASATSSSGSRSMSAGRSIVSTSSTVGSGGPGAKRVGPSLAAEMTAEAELAAAPSPADPPVAPAQLPPKGLNPLLSYAVTASSLSSLSAHAGMSSAGVWSSASELNGISLLGVGALHRRPSAGAAGAAAGISSGMEAFSLFSMQPKGRTSPPRMKPPPPPPSLIGAGREEQDQRRNHGPSRPLPLDTSAQATLPLLLQSLSIQSIQSSATIADQLSAMNAIASLGLGQGSLAPAPPPLTGPRPSGGTAPRPPPAGERVINEVVCGALMSSYERAGKWKEAVGVLDRARALGLRPNHVMYNTAMSAAGKAGKLDVVEHLFDQVKEPDTITYETLIVAYGMAGLPVKAESVFHTMVNERRLIPRDYAYCGLIAAHSLTGDINSALAVRQRMRREGAPLTVHVYNALLAACERGGQYERALELYRSMLHEGVEPNLETQQLITVVGRCGVASVEGQQAATAAMSAAFAAAGSMLLQQGLF